MICDTCGIQQKHLLYDLFRCPSCDLISSEDKEFTDIYDKNYIQKYYEYAKTDLGRRIVELRVNQVLKYVPNNENTTILDFGCGSGEFVLEANKHFIVSGYDINPESPWCNPSSLVQYWDVITFWDSIEHTSSPRQILSSLNPQYVFIAVPCVDDFPGANLTEWKHYRPHEHIHYYSEKALRNLLLSLNYKILNVNFDEADLRKGFNGKNIITIIGTKEII